MKALRCVCGYPYIMSASPWWVRMKKYSFFKYRESAAVVEWTLYQSSTEDDSQKTEPPLKDLIISVQDKSAYPWVPVMEFFQVLATLFTIMCVVSYLCFGEENQVVDEIIAILDVESLKQRVQGDFPCFFHPSGQEGCMVLWPLIWGFRWCLISKVILNLVDAHLP